ISATNLMGISMNPNPSYALSDLNVVSTQTPSKFTDAYHAWHLQVDCPSSEQFRQSFHHHRTSLLVCGEPHRTRLLALLRKATSKKGACLQTKRFPANSGCEQRDL